MCRPASRVSPCGRTDRPIACRARPARREARGAPPSRRTPRRRVGTRADRRAVRSGDRTRRPRLPGSRSRSAAPPSMRCTRHRSGARGVPPGTRRRGQRCTLPSAYLAFAPRSFIGRRRPRDPPTELQEVSDGDVRVHPRDRFLMARREHLARSALWLPLFDALSDPTVCARLAAEAEEAGWHGFFVWDQLRWEAPVRQVADSWITLAAIATATERLRIGPMVTPLPRRRPVKVARETATLDWLSAGRLTLGVGIGGDGFAREFSKTGEQLDERARGQMLDEALEILTAAWSGEPVHHHGDHYTVDDIQFLPDRCSDPTSRSGLQGSPATSSQCGEPPDTTGSFPPISSTPINSPRSSPASPSCATTRRHRTTSSLASPLASIPRRTSRPVPHGGSRSSPPSAVAGQRAGRSPSRTLRTVSAARSATPTSTTPNCGGTTRTSRGSGGASGRSRARRRLRYRPDHARGRPRRRQRQRGRRRRLRSHARAGPPAQRRRRD